MKILTRPAYIFLGYLSLALGVIGIFLPVMPTTPFIIVAAFCFSKSNKKIHRWLRQHKIFGSALRDWESHKVIKTKFKIIASITMTSGLIYPIFFSNYDKRVNIVIISVLAIVFIFIWSRPSKAPLKHR